MPISFGMCAGACAWAILTGAGLIITTIKANENHLALAQFIPSPWCQLLSFGLDLPNRDLVARRLCIGRIGRQLHRGLHVLDGSAK